VSPVTAVSAPHHSLASRGALAVRNRPSPENPA